jgi:hypothetical protein
LEFLFFASLFGSRLNYFSQILSPLRISHETKHFTFLVCSPAKKSRICEQTVAQDLCNPHHFVEETQVSFRSTPLFHKLINTCVENFTLQKYFFLASASLLLPQSPFHLPRDLRRRFLLITFARCVLRFLVIKKRLSAPRSFRSLHVRFTFDPVKIQMVKSLSE